MRFNGIEWSAQPPGRIGLASAQPLASRLSRAAFHSMVLQYLTGADKRSETAAPLLAKI